MREQLNRREALAAITRYAMRTLSPMAMPALATDLADVAPFDSWDAALAAMLHHAAQGEVVGHG